MTVGELIEKLERFDRDTLIVTRTYADRDEIHEWSPLYLRTVFIERSSLGGLRDVTDKERERDEPAILL